MIDYESYILNALQKAMIAAMVGSPIPVKYVATNFVSPNNGKWWEIVYIPNNLTGEFWSEGKTFKGFIRLILHWPQDGKGAYIAQQEVARVASKFTKGSLFKDSDNIVTVKIDDNPNVTGVIEQSPEILFPLTVRYSCFRIS